jgi:hypothetical protein
MRGKTYHISDEGPAYRMNGVHGEAKALHVEITPAADGVANIVTHIKVKFLFPFVEDLG